MQYFIDCEFDGFQGALMSMAIVREDGESIYLKFPVVPTDRWVIVNVFPLLSKCPVTAILCTDEMVAPNAIFKFIDGDNNPVFVADWPVDIMWLCDLMITGPGRMIYTPLMVNFMLVRVDAYPTDLEGAVQHNAWWDAMALRHVCQKKPEGGLC